MSLWIPKYVSYFTFVHVPKKIHIWGISKIVQANFSVISAKSHFILDCSEQLHCDQSSHYGGGGNYSEMAGVKKPETDGETYCSCHLYVKVLLPVCTRNCSDILIKYPWQLFWWLVEKTDGETYCGVTFGRERREGWMSSDWGRGIISIQKTCRVTLAIIFISHVFFWMTCRRSCASVSMFVFDHMPGENL